MKMYKMLKNKFLLLTIIIFGNIYFIKAQDTITVCSYNVLNFGDNCQGSVEYQKQFLKTIFDYEKPDVFGLIKLYPIQRYPGDFSGYLSPYFCDSICNDVFQSTDKSFKYAPYSNEARGSDMNVLFYNENKMQFVKSEVLYSEITDFDFYTFFYKDSMLEKHHDTTFIHFILLHTESGDDASTRNHQISQMFQKLKERMSFLPNLIILGDFNTRSSEEIDYKLLTQNNDSNFNLIDPPFGFDSLLTYPAMWDKNVTYSKWFTTSTRKDPDIPNSCGTSGGAKNWYDHLLFSNWIQENKNYVQYVHNSYHTIGNDGKRRGISVNDSTTNGKNNSIPIDLADALFKFSNKYPITAKFIASSNKTGKSLNDPKWSNLGIGNTSMEAAKYYYANHYFHFQSNSISNINHLNGQIIDINGKAIKIHFYKNDEWYIANFSHVTTNGMYWVILSQENSEFKIPIIIDDVF